MSFPSQARVYRGSTVDELIPQIQRELGPDAIVLRRREGLTGGFLGFFQRSFVELEAVPGGPRIDVYDEERGGSSYHSSPAPGLPLPDVPRTVPHPPLAHPFAAPAATVPSPSLPREPVGREGVQAEPIVRGEVLTAHGAYVTEQLAALAMAGTAEGQAGAASGPAVGLSRESGSPVQPREEPPHLPATDSFAAALASAEAQPVPSAPTRSVPTPPAPTRSVPARSTRPVSKQSTPPAVVRPVRPAPGRPSVAREPWSVPPASPAPSRAGVGIEKRLVGFGMGEDFARQTIETARAHVLPLAPGTGLKRAVRSALAQRIPVAPPLPLTGGAIVVVGAGGSGKTSCCAALMRAYRQAGTLSAGYAALTWSEERPGLHILLAPHVMWPTPVSAQRSLRALRRARGEGVVVLDTPRLSPADRGGVRELAGLLGELEPQRVVVALPATLGATAAAQLLEALHPLGANALAVTHADETDQIGVAVEAACSFGLAPELRLDRSRTGGWRVARMDPAGLAERLLP
jgi:hypothetical protein